MSFLDRRLSSGKTVREALIHVAGTMYVINWPIGFAGRYWGWFLL